MTNPQTLPPPPAGVTFADEPVASQTQQTAPASLPPPPDGVQFVDEPQMTSPDASEPGFISKGISAAGRGINGFLQGSLGTNVDQLSQPSPNSLGKDLLNTTIDTLIGPAGTLIKSAYNGTVKELQEARDLASAVKQYGRTSQEAQDAAVRLIPFLGDPAVLAKQAYQSGDKAGALGQVAGIVSTLMAPELIGKGAALAERAGSKIASRVDLTALGARTGSAADEAAARQGVSISPGRAGGGLANSAENVLRKDAATSAPYEAADIRTNQEIQKRGYDIADSMYKTDKTNLEQGSGIQDALQTSRDEAGAQVGDVHKAISQLDNPVINPSPIEDLARQKVKELTINNPNFAGLETDESKQAADFISNFQDLNGKNLDFDTAGKALDQINNMIPNVPSKAGGALKQLSSAIKEQMYQALPDDLARRLRDSHQRYADVTQDLNTGFGKRLLGTRANPTSPELVAKYLTQGANDLNISTIKNLLGPERTPQVQRAVLQNLIDSTMESNGGVVAGNKFYNSWSKITDAAKKALYSPEQLQTIDQYVKDVQTINLQGPRNLPETFSGSSSMPTAIHSPQGMILNLGSNAVMKLGGRRLARLLLDPPVARDLTKALNTLPTDRGAAQLGQRLVFAAHQSEVRDRQADASATTPQ